MFLTTLLIMFLAAGCGLGGFLLGRLTRPKPEGRRAAAAPGARPGWRSPRRWLGAFLKVLSWLHRNLLMLELFLKIPPHLKSPENWETHLCKKHLGLPAPAEAAGYPIRLDLLQKQYEMQVGLYEKYLDLLIKFNIFHFAVVGGVLSYAVSYMEEDNLIRLSLFFPSVMSIFFAVLTLLAARSLKRINSEIFYTAEFLGFQAPGVNTLRQALSMNFWLLCLSAALLFYVATYPGDIRRRFHREPHAAEKEAARSPTGGEAPTPAAPAQPPAPTQAPAPTLAPEPAGR